jgi:hypothetical protein
MRNVEAPHRAERDEPSVAAESMASSSGVDAGHSRVGGILAAAPLRMNSARAEQAGDKQSAACDLRRDNPQVP